jgi:hypothetical protein
MTGRRSPKSQRETLKESQPASAAVGYSFGRRMQMEKRHLNACTVCTRQTKIILDRDAGGFVRHRKKKTVRRKILLLKETRFRITPLPR